MSKSGPKKATPIETDELCHYGCGNQAKYQNHSGNLMCAESASSCDANKMKNTSGLVAAHNKARDNHPEGKAGLYDHSSLGQETKDKMVWNKGKSFAEFGKPGKGRFKNALLLERGHQCEMCGLSEWLGGPIPLEMDHIDGDSSNNTRENLRLLCSNCHALTPTWRRKKKNKNRHVHSELTIAEAILRSTDLEQALTILKTSSRIAVLWVMKKRQLNFKT